MCSEWPTCFCLLPTPNSTAIQKMFLAIHLSLSKNVQVFIEIIPLSLTNTSVLYMIQLNSIITKSTMDINRFQLILTKRKKKAAPNIWKLLDTDS